MFKLLISYFLLLEITLETMLFLTHLMEYYFSYHWLAGNSKYCVLNDHLLIDQRYIHRGLRWGLSFRVCQFVFYYLKNIIFAFLCKLPLDLLSLAYFFQLIILFNQVTFIQNRFSFFLIHIFDSLRNFNNFWVCVHLKNLNFNY